MRKTDPSLHSRVFYRPIEAAIRWSGLLRFEARILDSMNGKVVPDLEDFPRWPMLRLNAERIFDGIRNGELSYGTRDTTSRLKVLLEQEGFKTAVLRASVDASRREDWIAEQIDRGIDVLITNPELVKTGLDLLEFPTIVFMQSGYNVYSLQQAARRSWRIGQKQPVRVIYLGYAATSQMTCLGLMAKKITVSQSTSGDVPESGLDALNQDGDSVEVALARQLVH